MGDYVYALSSSGVTSTNLTSMEESASIELAYRNPYQSYYSYDESATSETLEDDEASESSSDDEEGQSSGSSSASSNEPNQG
jgi:hypothetical protein